MNPDPESGASGGYYVDLVHAQEFIKKLVDDVNRSDQRMSVAHRSNRQESWRILNNSHRIALNGESRRCKKWINPAT